MTTDIIDLRSDTVTQPTDAMREAMYRAEVGDDVVGEDPTINRLEARCAELLGKEAALFVPSGTFGNQCAILTHCRSADEVIISENAHIIIHEAGAAALLSRVQFRTIPAADGYRVTADQVTSRIRQGDDIHYPRTGLICLEQATAGGTLYDMETLQSIYAVAQRHGIPMHMDGARLFNAAVALNVEPAAMAACTDTVCICLSKGLCAPVGSLLAGSAEFIDHARKNRKRMGGGMRQAGFLAAAGLIALDDMRLRLDEDHQNARLLASLLAETPGVTLLAQPEISMVFFRIPSDINEQRLVETLESNGLVTYPPEDGEWRFVTHHPLTAKDMRRAMDILRHSLIECAATP